MEERIKFAETLKSLLQNRGVTLETLAHELGTTRQSIHQYTAGKAYPKYDALIKIADFFGVSVDYLLTGKKNEYRGVRSTLNLDDKAIETLQSLSSNEDLWQRLSPYINEILANPSFYSALLFAIAEFERISEKEGNVSSQEISGVWFSVHESVWGFFREFFRDNTNIKKFDTFLS